MKKTKIAIRELHGKELAAIWPLVHLQNPTLKRAEFDRRLKKMLPLGYRCIAAFDGKKPVGVCGFWLSCKFWCGPYIEPDNLVVDPAYRRAGVGKKLFDWIEKEGRTAGARMMVFDTYVTAFDAHHFHFRQGYHILGYHMVKHLKETA